MSIRSAPFRIIARLAAFSTITFFGAISLLAGEPQWVEVRSPNFSVVTDAGEKHGREVAMRFEQMRAVFGALLVKVNVSLPIPLQIVAFRNTKEMRQVAPLFNGKPTQVSGLFQSGADRSFIMLDMSVEDPWHVVFHEYAHQLMNGNLKGELDPWFEEGFAEYFSSIEVDSKEARVGKVPREEYLILHQVGMMRIADLFKVQHNSQTYNESGDHRTTFYAESGMLVHYIFDNQLTSKIATYFDLKQNRHSIEDAIQQAFGMSAAQFDKALRNYVTSGHFKYYSIPTQASNSSNSYSATPLTPATANAVLADIHLHSRDYHDQALAEFQEILKSDPQNAAACRGLGYAYLQNRNFAEAAFYFSRSSQLDPKDPRVHYYNALLMATKGGFGTAVDFPAMTKELETSIGLDPGFADSYALLAFVQSSSGDAPKALVTMRKALEISPRNENYWFNLANIYSANRQPDQAIAILQSLQASGNPEFASRATVALALARATKNAMNSGPQLARDPVIASRDEGNPIKPEDAPAPSRPAKFLTGTLTNADCANPPSALLTLVSGSKTWTMRVADRSHLVLIGANEFSCSWSDQKVAVNYRETADGEANVISLEIQ